MILKATYKWNPNKERKRSTFTLLYFGFRKRKGLVADDRLNIVWKHDSDQISTRTNVTVWVWKIVLSNMFIHNIKTFSVSEKRAAAFCYWIEGLTRQQLDGRLQIYDVQSTHHGTQCDKDDMVDMHMTDKLVQNGYRVW